MASIHGTTAIVTVIGVAVAITGLLFLGCGPNPGGGCSVGSGMVLTAYLFGAIGAVLIVAGSRGHIMKMRSAVRSTGTVLLAVASGVVGGAVMLLGLLFGCAGSLIIPGSAGCGVGTLSALIGYMFGMVGAVFVTVGILEIGIWAKDSPAIAVK